MMSSTDAGHRSVSFAAPELKKFIRRRSVELFGLVLVVVTLSMMLAVATHDPADPSWNKATSGGAANALGAPGAVFADLMLQSVGPIALLMLLVPFCLSVRIVGHRLAQHNRLRIVATLVAGFVAAMSLGGLSGSLGLAPVAAGGISGAGGSALADLVPNQFAMIGTAVSAALLIAALMVIAWASAVPPGWLALPFTGMSLSLIHI